MWTQEEDAILKNNYHSGTKKVARLLPDKTIHVIEARAQKLGVKSNYWWKPWEDEIIKETMDSKPKAIQEKLPHRSKSSIIHRRKKLRREL